MDSAASLAEIRTPKGSPGLTGRLLSGPTLPALAARFAASRTSGSGPPWRFGSTVIVIAHEHVTEALKRDLEFAIAPVNAQRIRDVDDAFILGMDRQGTLAAERKALYRALTNVDLEPIRGAAEADADASIVGKDELDIIPGYARLVAAHTAQRLFGVTGPDDAMFCEIARSIFGHTFLNLSNDHNIRKRAVKAAEHLIAWLDAEIARRRQTGQLGSDMMGKLLVDGSLADDGIRRTLAGMLVGSIDTTASAVAKIIFVLGQDGNLRRMMEADCDNQQRMLGWCLEALRRWPHNPILLRHAMRDTTLGGAEIRSGDRIFLWTQAAMQDASAFPDPQVMRPDRPQAAYLHFGGTLHHCAGRPVNTWQIPLLVSKLLQRGIGRVDKISWAGPFPAGLMVRFAS